MARVDFPAATRAAMLTAIRDRLDASANAGTLTIYAGEYGTADVELGKLTLSKPCADMVNGALVFRFITEDPMARADATATWSRLADGDGGTVIDTDVSSLSGTG